MLIDCGAGTTEVAIISLGCSCLSRAVRIGGDTVDDMIRNHIRARYHFEIGLRTAEKGKLELAALDKAADHGGRMIDVSGKDRHGGLPGRLSVPAEELLSLVRVYVGMIVDAVKASLAQTSPELSRDILDDGVTLTGGSSAIALLSEGIADATGLCVRIADRPRACVAVGLSSILSGTIAEASRSGGALIGRSE